MANLTEVEILWVVRRHGFRVFPTSQADNVLESGTSHHGGLFTRLKGCVQMLKFAPSYIYYIVKPGIIEMP